MSKLEDDPPVPVDGCAYSAYTTSTMYRPGQGSAQLLCGYHKITTLAITYSENERRIGIGSGHMPPVLVVLNTWSSITHTPSLCLPSRLGSIFLSIHRSRHHRASQGIPFSPPIDCSKLPKLLFVKSSGTHFYHLPARSSHFVRLLSPSLRSPLGRSHSHQLMPESVSCSYKDSTYCDEQPIRHVQAFKPLVIYLFS